MVCEREVPTFMWGQQIICIFNFTFQMVSFYDSKSILNFLCHTKLFNESSLNLPSFKVRFQLELSYITFSHFYVDYNIKGQLYTTQVGEVILTIQVLDSKQRFFF